MLGLKSGTAAAIGKLARLSGLVLMAKYLGTDPSCDISTARLDVSCATIFIDADAIGCAHAPTLTAPEVPASCVPRTALGGWRAGGALGHVRNGSIAVLPLDFLPLRHSMLVQITLITDRGDSFVPSRQRW